MGNMPNELLPSGADYVPSFNVKPNETSATDTTDLVKPPSNEGELDDTADPSLVEASVKGDLTTATEPSAPLAEPFTEAELLDRITQYISRTYVRKDKGYFLVTDPSQRYSAEDVVRSLLFSLPEVFPSRLLTDALIKQAVKHAMVTKHSDRLRSIPTWNGKTVCKPGQFGSFVWDQGFVSINSWVCPDYRLLEGVQPNTRMLDLLLERIMPHKRDRWFVKNMLAWSLQNEEKKNGWATIFYSRNKGTGKSTFLQLLSKLFGEGNTINCTSIDSVIGRFSGPVFEKKLVTIEEVKLQQGSRASNAMKTFITETNAAVERKGQDLRQIEQCATFYMTTNHPPRWIEEGERRLLVVEVDHPGHAHGPEREVFAQFIKGYKNAVIDNPTTIAAIYLGLMAHEIPADFDPYSLPIDQIDTPIMRRVFGAAEVQKERLEEFLNREGVKAIPQDDLCRKVQEKLGLSANRLSHMMDELGWHSEKKKWGGKDYQRVLWLRPGYTLHQGRVTDATGKPVPISYNNAYENEEVEIIEQTPSGDTGGADPLTEEY